jgi:heat shock protein HslJ
MNKQTKTITLLLSLIMGSLLLTGCANNSAINAEGIEPVEKTIFVGAEKAACQGVAPQECYLIKENAAADWEYFYDEIAGFNWEPGFEYELRIQETQIANPPADAASLKWTLLEVVGKTAVSNTNDTNQSLVGNIWVLQTTSQPILPETTITIEFNTDGQVNGSAGCNSYFGSYSLNSDSLITSPIGSTEMWCEGLMEQESAFLQMLQTATGLTVTENSLTIHTSDGDMQFAPAENAALEETDWVLSGIAQGDAVVNTWIDANINIQFNDGQISGSAGCNSYGGRYQIDGSSLTLSELVSTMMACEEEVSQRETEFLAALATVSQFRTEMTQLILSDSAGQDVLFFCKSQKVF